MLGFSAMFRYLLLLTLLVAPSYGQDKPAEPPSPPPTSARQTPVNPPPSKPRVLKSVPADYPTAAQDAGIQGQVLLKIIISEKGDVENAEVLSGDEALTKSALKAIKKWKFEPSIVDGKPTKVRATIPFNFHFGDKTTDGKEARLNGAILDGSHGKAEKLPPNLVKGWLIHRVDPVYPRAAQMNRVQGVVILHALIGKDGLVTTVTPISGPPELVQAAIGAVQQWCYKPYLHLGEPAEVDTTVEVNFSLRPH